MTKKTVISIVGPTAIGKTALSIILAQQFDTEIISADSRQFYKEMTIGTAVPEPNELSAAKHHFIQHLSIHHDYSVGQYESDAIDRINALFTNHETLILVGGSGLYQKAISDGLDDFPEIDPIIRQELVKQLKGQGILVLQEQLKTLDPISYEHIDLKNPQRLIRAIEVSKGTGVPFSSYKTRPKKERPFHLISIGITAPRDTIYQRINKRVDLMMKNGLLEEAKFLHEFKDLNALNTVGYKELFEFFESKITLEEAVEKIKRNTRRFAKRQLTWYRKDDSIKWFNHPLNYEEVIEYLDLKLKE